VSQSAPSNAQFEVHARRGSRWLIEATGADVAIAQEQAQQLLRRSDVEGVRIWKEIHDPVTRRTAGRIVSMEEKPRPKRRWRAKSRALPAQGKATAAPEPTRRRMTAPPRSPGDGRLALTTIAGACAALVALAVIAGSS
jgi:hypothetical protein